MTGEKGTTGEPGSEGKQGPTGPEGNVVHYANRITAPFTEHEEATGPTILEVPSIVKLTVRFCGPSYGGRANIVSLSSETELFAEPEVFTAQGGSITYAGPGWGPFTAREELRPANLRITSGTAESTRIANVTLNMGPGFEHGMRVRRNRRRVQRLTSVQGPTLAVGKL
jgi:hypothetical protein